MSMHGQVTVWKMTEEERLAYIAKHPIITKKKERPITFSSDVYKWRGKKVAAAKKEKQN